MTLVYMKVPAEEAVQILEQHLVAGYRLKDILETEYQTKRSAGQTITDDDINSWSKRSVEWATGCFNELGKVFTTPRQQYTFKEIKTDGLYREGYNYKYEALIKTLQARIDKLDEYINFIFQRSNITIVSAGRDVNMQTGDSSDMEVKN
jgi:hypothetical protein